MHLQILFLAPKKGVYHERQPCAYLDKNISIWSENCFSGTLINILTWTHAQNICELWISFAFISCGLEFIPWKYIISKISLLWKLISDYL